jgi:uncharacterized membrane protein YqjE
LHSLRQLGATALGMLQTRLSIAGVELEEELQRALGMLVMALTGLLFVALALVVLTFLVVFATAESERILVMGVLSALYLAIAIFFGMRLNSALTRRPPMFAATLAELAKDRAALGPARVAQNPIADEPTEGTP